MGPGQVLHPLFYIYVLLLAMLSLAHSPFRPLSIIWISSKAGSHTWTYSQGKCGISILILLKPAGVKKTRLLTTFCHRDTFSPDPIIFQPLNSLLVCPNYCLCKQTPVQILTPLHSGSMNLITLLNVLKDLLICRMRVQIVNTSQACSKK